MASRAASRAADGWVLGGFQQQIASVVIPLVSDSLNESTLTPTPAVSSFVVSDDEEDDDETWEGGPAGDVGEDWGCEERLADLADLGSMSIDPQLVSRISTFMQEKERESEEGSVDHGHAASVHAVSTAVSTGSTHTITTTTTNSNNNNNMDHDDRGVVHDPRMDLVMMMREQQLASSSSTTSAAEEVPEPEEGTSSLDGAAVLHKVQATMSDSALVTGMSTVISEQVDAISDLATPLATSLTNGALPAWQVRVACTAIALGPPAVAALGNPDAFMGAMSVAGAYFDTFIYGIIPPLMVLAWRAERMEMAMMGEEKKKKKKKKKWINRRSREQVVTSPPITSSSHVYHYNDDADDGDLSATSSLLTTTTWWKRWLTRFARDRDEDGEDGEGKEDMVERSGGSSAPLVTAAQRRAAIVAERIAPGGRYSLYVAAGLASLVGVSHAVLDVVGGH